MIHTRALRAAGALACATLATACATDATDLMPAPYDYGADQVVSSTERACSGAVGGGAGPVQSLAWVGHTDTGDGRALAFVVNGGVTAATTVLRAYAPGIQRTVAVQDGRVVANLVTDQNGTRDADGDPVVEHNAVLMPVTDMAGTFTGAAWSASMEVADRLVSTCGTPPTDVPADAP